MQYLKIIVDGIFSFATFMIVTLGIFFFFIFTAMEQETESRRQAQAAAEACYDMGAVKVDTDAGARCVLPSNLMPVK